MINLHVIIPAHNEENLILNTIKPYLSYAGVKICVIVVCNGCTDSTYEKVKSLSNDIQVFDLLEGSKIAAINYAYDKIRNICKNVLVQDADVLIDVESIESLLHFIAISKDYTFASSVPYIDLDGASFFVKEYYDFLRKTPSFKIGMVSSGCYLLSNDAIKKVFPFPNVIADDGYVKAKLLDCNLSVITECKSVVLAPKNVMSLIKIKTRSKLGNIQLKKFFSLTPSKNNNSLISLIYAAIKYKKLLGLLVYIFITIVCKFRAEFKLKKSDLTWERDNSTR